MRVSYNEFLEELKRYTNERSDDETLKLLEDFSDSFSDVSFKEEIAKIEDEWRNRYRERFFEDIEEKLKEKNDKAKEIKVISTDRLFKEEE